MSRIGKLAIKLGDKVKASVAGQRVQFEGPRGKLSIAIPSPEITVEVKDGQVVVRRPMSPGGRRAFMGSPVRSSPMRPRACPPAGSGGWIFAGWVSAQR